MNRRRSPAARALEDGVRGMTYDPDDLADRVSLLVLGPNDVVDVIAVAAASEDEGVVDVAAQALRRTGNPLLGDWLAPVLRADSATEAVAALEVLSAIGLPRIGEEAAALLRHPDAAVRVRAAHAMGLVPEAVPLLEAALRDPDDLVRAAAAEGLGSVGDLRATEALVQAFGAVDLVADDRISDAAILEALGALKDPRGLPLLTAVASGPANPVDLRWAAVSALGEYDHPIARRALRDCLRDPLPTVRMTAADALGRSGDRSARTDLLPILTDESAIVRGAAAEALGKLGVIEDLEPLSSLLDDEGLVHPGARVNDLAAAAMRQIERRSR